MEKKIGNLENLKGTDHILCAWGTNPNLTKKISLNEKEIKYFLGCQYTVNKLNLKELSNNKILIISDDPNIGYFYVFPKNNSKANVGVIVNQKQLKDPFKILDKFISLNFNSQISKYNKFAKLVAIHPPLTLEKIINNDKILPLGDAMFASSSISGGGIGYALLTSKIAIECLKSKNPQKEFYNKLQPLIKKLEKDSVLSEKLYPSTKEKRKFINNLLWGEIQKQIKQQKYLSLSNIAINLI